VLWLNKTQFSLQLKLGYKGISRNAVTNQKNGDQRGLGHHFVMKKINKKTKKLMYKEVQTIQQNPCQWG
jgi:hypothetical protein